nr:SRPBCC domain-containing protein [Gemmatimonadaceae bacterium]
YPNENVFLALDPGRRVVIRHDCAPYFTLTVTLTEVPGGTRLEWEQRFDDAATAAAVRAVCIPANEENLDRLTRVLETAATR